MSQSLLQRARQLLSLVRYLIPLSRKQNRQIATWVLAHHSSLINRERDPEPSWGYDYSENNCGGHAMGMYARWHPAWGARIYRNTLFAELLGRPGVSTYRLPFHWSLVLDGLIPFAAAKPHKEWPDGWVVAAYVAKGEDYHFLRPEPDGSWTEKPGSYSARKVNIQDAQDILTRPRDGVNYELVGFYWFSPERYKSGRLSQLPQNK